MKRSLLVILLTSLMGGAMAQEATPKPYVKLELGTAILNNTNPSAETREQSYLQDDGKSISRIALGHDVTPLVSTELGFFKSMNYERNYREFQVKENHTHTGNSKAYIQGVDLSTIIRPMGAGIYFKGGMHHSYVKSKSIDHEILSATNIDTVHSTQSDSGWGWLAGAGFEHRFTNNIAGDISYTRYQNLGGRKDLHSDVWSAGVKYMF